MTVNVVEIIPSLITDLLSVNLTGRNHVVVITGMDDVVTKLSTVLVGPV